MKTLPPDPQSRLETEANIWLASTRPDGRPHLVPVWFVWHNSKLYTCVQSQSVKVHNIEQNPQVALALEDGSNVLICEGTAVFLPTPWSEVIIDIFQAKYNWNIVTDREYDCLLEVTPIKWLTW